MGFILAGEWENGPSALERKMPVFGRGRKKGLKTFPAEAAC